MKLQSKLLSTLALAAVLSSSAFSQSKIEIPKDTKFLESGVCENQQMTGTCWSFSGMAFFQAELNRMGKFKDLNLSEMFVVRNIYPLKGENYVRMHGKANFGEGGEFTDDLLCLRQFGLVPQSAYSGLQGLNYNHEKMVKKLDSIVTTAAKSNGTLDTKWKTEFNKTLSQSLGDTPETFSYEGKTYSPKSFAEATGLKANDYVMISSFTHHPYYQKHVLEVPDNWNWEQVYNVPLAEITEIAKSAVEKGFPVAWGADVTGTFNAHLPLQQLQIKDGKELEVSPEMRQQSFDNYETQDDHAMLIVGLAKDNSGKEFFKVKNSWGTGIAAGEYFYASFPYVSMMTTCIMVHKDALPKALKKKLNIS
ncbi:C1 family peptidase [Pedobacter aquatilis]|uniref:C1 family peptidase n=1 Tax=Pedobacter aquatilis TaxID=351343 RepID=UPI00292E7833|nr:C1 family peptidase [Pedobacter aquatilis]